MEIPEFKFAVREDLKDCGIDFLPTRATSRSAGWDVKAAFKDIKLLKLYPFETAKIPLGFRGFCPEGWWYELKPRSSTFGKKNMHCLYGTIDEDYEGELLLACQYIPPQLNRPWEEFEYYGMISAEFDSKPLVINFGDALGQIIPVKRQEMIVMEVTNEEYDELCRNRQGTRGAGGFGSTSE